MGEVSTISTVAPGISRAPSVNTSLSSVMMTALVGVSGGGAEMGVVTYSMREAEAIGTRCVDVQYMLLLATGMLVQILSMYIIICI